MTTLTWLDLCDFIGDIYAKEGAKPKPKTYRMLGNQALAILSGDGRTYYTSWTSSGASATLTISGNDVTFPMDVVEVQRVSYDGEELYETTLAELDELDTEWRDTSSTPEYYAKTGSGLVIYPKIAGTAAELIVYGWGTLPEFSDSEGATNPLSLLPHRDQLLPAYYILANLPVDEEKQTEVMRREKYQAMWDSGLQAYMGDALSRKHSVFTY